jgi:hypothetical protein
MVRRMIRAVRDLDALAESLRIEAVPLVSDLRATVRQAGDDLDRVESVLGKAETIATTVDAASRLTYRALRPPLVKTMAFMSGAGRATRRLRGGTRAIGPAPDAASHSTDGASSQDVDVEATRPDGERPRLSRRCRPGVSRPPRSPPADRRAKAESAASAANRD